MSKAVDREFFGGPADGDVRHLEEDVRWVVVIVERKDGRRYYAPLKPMPDGAMSKSCEFWGICTTHINEKKYSVHRYDLDVMKGNSPSQDFVEAFCHAGNVIKGELHPGTIDRGQP
jgi:hypothetical protein